MRLLIVDDEKNIRDSIKDYIPWSELGIDFVDTAQNGKDALSQAQEKRPDILLTDVRMPKMDGIELAMRLKTLYPNCKIVFLSGYADKDYLKTAINLSAVDYIEKPVDMDEIKTAVLRAASLYDQEISHREEVMKIKNCLSESMPLIRQEIALQLVQSNYPAALMEEKLTDYSIRISESGWFTPLYALINWSADGMIQAAKKEELIRTFNEDIFCDHMLCGFDDGCNMVMIAGVKIGVNHKEFIDLIYREFVRNADRAYTFSIGAGHYVDELPMIPASFESAKRLTGMQFYSGTNRIFYEDDPKPFALDESVYSRFQDSLKNGRKDLSHEIVTQITDSALSCRDRNINHIKNIYFNLLLLLFEAARDREIIEPFGLDEKHYVWKEINRLVTIEALSKYLLSNIDEVYSSIEKRSGLGSRACGIIRYIQEHFQDNDLTLQSIAENVYLSQTYLCAFFKKATKKTLNQYITEVRIEKAKEFLKDDSVKIYEIANKVGFTDTNYFSSLFKKHVGCTPSEYKERGY